MSSPTDVARVAQPAGPLVAAWLQSEDVVSRRWELRGAATVGRSPDVDVVLDDPHVSRVHARLELVGGVWTLLDDGLSRNGTWLNGRRLRGWAQLHDRDRVRFGDSVLVFCAPATGHQEVTLVGAPLLAVGRLTAAQRAVLTALARPCRDGGSWALPATNAQIADELFLSLDAVKTHLRLMFAKFGIDGLPQNAKRVRLAELALQVGLLDGDLV